MSNIKKIIGVVLALVMVLSVATIAFAADGDAYSVAFTADKTTLNAGESATVTVKITSNFNVSAMSIPVFFDNSKVTVTAATTLPADKTKIATEADPDVDKYFQGSGHTKDDYGIRALVYVAKQSDSIRSYSDEAVMTLTVTAKEGASGAVVLECISTTVKTSANPSGTLYLAKNASGSAEVDSLGEVIDNATVTGAKATITIAGATADPELILTDTGIGAGVVIDRVSTCNENGFIYGIDTDQGLNIADYVTTLTGSVEVVANDQGNYSTGATVLLKDNGGTIIETYYFVFFGDINGDGWVDNGDVSTIDGVACYMDFSFEATDGTAMGLAADVNGDGWIDNGDVSTVDGVACYMTFPTQAEYAATVAANRNVNA